MLLLGSRRGNPFPGKPVFVGKPVVLVPKANASAGFAMMDDGDFVFSECAFNPFGKASLKPTGHIRLSGEYEEVFLALLGACRETGEGDNHDNKKGQKPDGVKLSVLIGHSRYSI